MNERSQLFLLVAMWGGAAIAAAALGQSRLRDQGDLPPLPTPGETTSPAAGAEEALPALRVQPGPERFSAYRGGPRHTGRTHLVGPRRPALRFAFDAGGPIRAQVVEDEAGDLYITTLGAPAARPAERPRSGEIIKLAPDGRTVRWRQELGGDVYSTPLLALGRVYVGSDADRYFSLAPEDGERRFILPTEGDADTGAAIAPDEHLIFAAGAHVYRMERSGVVRHRFEALNKIFTSPAVDAEGNVYVGSQDDRVYALGPDLEVKWRRPLGGDVDSSPVLGDDLAVFVASDDGEVRAFSAAGRPRFATDLGGHIRAPLALTHDGGVVAAVMGPRPRVVSLDATSGAIRFEFHLPLTETTELGPLSGPLVDGEGRIYFGSFDDFIYALERDGSLAWTYRVPGDVDAPPILLHDGTLVVGCDDGKVYALEDAARANQRAVPIGHDGGGDAGVPGDAGR